MSRVIVAGSINMDVVAKASRHPSPGETILGTTLSFIPGGKGANQALASAKLGTETLLVGCVGNDQFGSALCTFLEQSKVNLKSVKRIHKSATGTALIVVNPTGENTIVVIPGANEFLSADDVLATNCARNDIFVAQFETPLSTTTAIFRYGRSQGTRNILNPSPALSVPAELLALSDVVVLNATELQLLTGEVVSVDTGVDCCRKLRSFNEQIVVLTLGKDGVIASTGSDLIRVQGHQVDAVDTTGAGDCFVGALASRLALGLSLEHSIAFSNSAAAISVQRQGAGPSMPSLEEVESFQDHRSRSSQQHD